MGPMSTVNEKLKRAVLPLAAAIALVSGAGCVSMSSLQTAEVLPKGKTEQTFGGGFYTSPDFNNATNSNLNIPFVELSYREGLFDNFDFGAKLTIIGSAVLDGKYQIVKGESFAFSVGGGLGYLTIESGSGDQKLRTTTIDVMIPAYASYKFSDTFTWYASPRYVFRNSSSTGPGASSASTSLVGASTGIKIGSTWGAYIEGGYQRSLSSSFNALQANVSFFWDGGAGVLTSTGLF